MTPPPLVAKELKNSLNAYEEKLACNQCFIYVIDWNRNQLIVHHLETLFFPWHLPSMSVWRSNRDKTNIEWISDST